MSTEPLLRVRSIQVDGLFDLFDHRVDLKLDDRVTILHGPNGAGKTMLLRMVSDLLVGRYSVFRQVPFRRFSLQFTDDTRLELTIDKPTERTKSPRAGSKPNGYCVSASRSRVATVLGSGQSFG